LEQLIGHATRFAMGGARAFRLCRLARVSRYV